MRLNRCIVSSAIVFALTASRCGAALLDVGPGGFTPLAPTITFDEVPLGTVNPSYFFPAVPGLGDVTVSFAGSFVGQTITGGGVSTLDPSTPTGPLTLDGGNTVTVNDGAPGATSPVLSGDPTFNGPISVLFSTPVAAVGLKGGYFDTLNATSIQAYDANGNVLGSITNSVLGFEFYGLKDSSLANVISGISFFITGNEPGGFEIDNLTFGSATQVTPEPSSIVLCLIGVGAVLLGRVRRRFVRPAVL